jgi:putative endonuclease
MPANRRAEGNHAEGIAVAFLEARGMRIVERNFHFGRMGELDIIAEEFPEPPLNSLPILVFVEVKARRNDRYGSPESGVTPAKQRTVRRTAEGYLFVRGIADRECRFDVVAIRMDTNPPTVNHIVNAF